MATCRQTPLHVNNAFYVNNTFPTQGCAVATRRPSVLGQRMQQVRSLPRSSRAGARLPALSGALSGAVLHLRTAPVNFYGVNCDFIGSHISQEEPSESSRDIWTEALSKTNAAMATDEAIPEAIVEAEAKATPMRPVRQQAYVLIAALSLVEGVHGTHTHTHAHTYTHTHTHTHEHTQLPPYTHTHMNTGRHTKEHASTRTHR